MTVNELKNVLASHSKWLKNEPGGRRAILCDMDLSGADLSSVDLHDAKLTFTNLSGANLIDANLSSADLSHTNLSYADLSFTNLSYADLNHANLCHADLSRADLNHAILCGADLNHAEIDYASYPLWCGSLNVKIDKRIAAQLLYHALRAMQSCDDEDVAAVLASEPCLKLANQFHRVNECGKIEPPTNGGR